MFTFSFNWLKRLSQIDLTLDEVINILSLQGLEVQKQQTIDSDPIITIEVKAHRPDCLSHLGLLRECYAYKNHSVKALDLANIAKFEGSSKDESDLDFKINILDQVCTRFTTAIIKNINNKAVLPEFITTSLEHVGVSSVNPVVDILNYLLFQFGQPLHAYDYAKLTGQELIIKNNTEEFNFKTLSGTDIIVPKNTIVIHDSKGPVTVAGIIGGDATSVTDVTQELVLEAAVFDPILVRKSSKALKISTPSAFRFERGVDNESTKAILDIAIEWIKKYVGGEVILIKDYYPAKRVINPVIIRKSQVSKILGLDLSADKIANLLAVYGIEIIKQDATEITVTPPSFRLDLTTEIEYIEEIARAYGYHNIAPTLPKMAIQYVNNKNWDLHNELRAILVGFNFYETLNYAFVPYNCMELLNITPESKYYGDILLQNPISRDHALMRPLLLYSLLQNISFNYSYGNKDLALFEIGRCYFRGATDTGFIEADTLGFIFTGVRIDAGFGITKPINYDFYDLINYIDLIFSALNLEYELIREDVPFFDSACSFKIKSNNINGFCGMVKDSVLANIPNGKLVKSKVFYFELPLININKQKKQIAIETHFPGITREYNFLVGLNQQVADIVAIIKDIAECAKRVQVKDLYVGKGVPEGKRSVLLTVDYGSAVKTLTQEEIAVLEHQFLAQLAAKSIVLKDL